MLNVHQSFNTSHTTCTHFQAIIILSERHPLSCSLASSLTHSCTYRVFVIMDKHFAKEASLFWAPSHSPPWPMHEGENYWKTHPRDSWVDQYISMKSQTKHGWASGSILISDFPNSGCISCLELWPGCGSLQQPLVACVHSHRTLVSTSNVHSPEKMFWLQ